MNRGYAVAVGVFAGIMSAVQFGTGLLDRLFFFLLAGAIAYVGCDVKGYARGIGRALREVAAWKPDWSDIRLRTQIILMLVLFGMSWGGLSFPLFNSLPGIEPASLTLFVFATALIATLLMSMHAIRPGTKIDPEDAQRVRTAVFVYANPVSLAFWFVRIVLILVALFGRSIPGLLRDLRDFALKTFAYTHTAERRVCFVDAVVLSAVGWYFSASIPYAMFIFAAIGFVVGKYHYPLTLDLAKRLTERFTPKPAPQGAGLYE